MKYLVLIGVIVLFGCQSNEIKVLDKYEFTISMKVARPSSRLDVHPGVSLFESCSIPVGTIVEIEKVEKHKLRFRIVQVKAGVEYCGLGMTFISNTDLRMYLKKVKS